MIKKKKKIKKAFKTSRSGKPPSLMSPSGIALGDKADQY
jgi:hypothetical protein